MKSKHHRLAAPATGLKKSARKCSLGRLITVTGMVVALVGLIQAAQARPMSEYRVTWAHESIETIFPSGAEIAAGTGEAHSARMGRLEGQPTRTVAKVALGAIIRVQY